MEKCPPELRENLKDIKEMALKLKLSGAVVENAWNLFIQLSVPPSKMKYSDKHAVSVVCLLIASRFVFISPLFPNSKLRVLFILLFFCIYRQDKATTPISLFEVAQVSRSTFREIKKCFSAVKKFMKIDLRHASVDPVTYVPRFCSQLGLSASIQEAAVHIAKNASMKVLCSRAPVSIAITAIFLARDIMGEVLTQDSLRRMDVLKTGTINRVYNEIKNHALMLLPEGVYKTFKIHHVKDGFGTFIIRS